MPAITDVRGRIIAPLMSELFNIKTRTDLSSTAEEVQFWAVTMNYDVILRMPWLVTNNPYINWLTGEIIPTPNLEDNDDQQGIPLLVLNTIK